MKYFNNRNAWTTAFNFRKLLTLKYITIFSFLISIVSSQSTAQTQDSEALYFRQIQNTLNTAGYNILIDGIWGPSSHLALNEFYEKNCRILSYKSSQIRWVARQVASAISQQTFNNCSAEIGTTIALVNAPSQFSPGDTVFVKISVANLGNTKTEGIVYRFSFPSAFEATLRSTVKTAGIFNHGSNAWTIGAMEQQEQNYITFGLEIKDDYCGGDIALHIPAPRWDNQKLADRPDPIDLSIPVESCGPSVVDKLQDLLGRNGITVIKSGQYDDQTRAALNAWYNRNCRSFLGSTPTELLLSNILSPDFNNCPAEIGTTISLVNAPSQFSPGDTVFVKISVANLGNTKTEGIVYRFLFPSAFEATLRSTVKTAGIFNHGSNAWTIGAMEQQEQNYITFGLEIKDDYCGGDIALHIPAPRWDNQKLADRPDPIDLIIPVKDCSREYTLQISDLNSQIVELTNALTLAENIKETQGLTLEKTSNELSQLKEFLNTETVRAEGLRVELESVKLQVAEKEVAMSTLAGEVERLTQEIESVKLQVAEKEVATSTLTGEVESLTQENFNLQEQIKSLNDELSDRVSEIKKLESELQQLYAGFNNSSLPWRDRLDDGSPWIAWLNDLPLKQNLFCDLLDEHKRILEEAIASQNQIRVNIALKDRKISIDGLLPNGKVEGWITQIREVKQESDGSAAVLLSLPCNANIGSGVLNQNGIREVLATIPYGDRIYRQLARVSQDDFVIVNGTLLEVVDGEIERPEAYFGDDNSVVNEKFTGQNTADIFPFVIEYLAETK